MDTTLTAPAASSPAPETTVFTPDSGEARAEFFKTGKMPETKADPSPAKESSAEGEKPEGKAAPASEAGVTQEPKHRSNAEIRLDEILDGLRAAGLTPAALKTFAKDYQRVGQQQAEAAKPEQKQAEPADSKAPVKPKPEDFEGKPWTEYEAAKDKYFEDLADYKATKAIEDDRAARQQETVSKELQTKLDDAKSRYGETAESTIRETSSAIFNDAKIAGVVKALVNDSPVLVDLLYVIGSKAEDMADFVKTAQSNPGAAIRKLVLIEKFVMEELAKGGKSENETAQRGDDGKFKAPEKKITAAPPPPKEVGATGAPPPDEVEAAIKRGDDRAAIDAMNRADIRRRKGH